MNDLLRLLFKGDFYGQIERGFNIHLGVADKLLLKNYLQKKTILTGFFISVMLKST